MSPFAPPNWTCCTVAGFSQSQSTGAPFSSTPRANSLRLQPFANRPSNRSHCTVYFAHTIGEVVAPSVSTASNSDGSPTLLAIDLRPLATAVHDRPHRNLCRRPLRSQSGSPSPDDRRATVPARLPASTRRRDPSRVLAPGGPIYGGVSSRP